MTPACRSSPPSTLRTRVRCSCRWSRYGELVPSARGRCYRAAGQARDRERDPYVEFPGQLHVRARLWASISSESSSVRFTLDEASAAGFAEELAGLRGVVDNELATRENLCGIALHGPAFEHVVVGGHALRCRGDGVVSVRVPEQNIGVEARRDGSLLLAHTEDVCGVGAV